MLRIADEADVDNIRMWRNQQRNRDASINSHEITPKEHAGWWAATRTNPGRRILIYERGGVPGGVVNFFKLNLDSDRKSGEWGWFLDAEGLDSRGELLPAFIEIMREGLEYAFETLDLNDLCGAVLSDNSVVRQMNRRFRFVEGEPEQQDTDGRLITVIPIRLRVEERRS